MSPPFSKFYAQWGGEDPTREDQRRGGFLRLARPQRTRRALNERGPDAFSPAMWKRAFHRSYAAPGTRSGAA